MTATTPHSHWSHYDEKLEMKSFNDLHTKLVAGETDTRIEEAELKILAQAYGYGEADGFIYSAGVTAPPEGESNYRRALREQFDDYQNGDYWNCIDGSENRLSAISPAAKIVAARACQAMRDCYDAGRTRRIGQDEKAETPAPAP